MSEKKFKHKKIEKCKLSKKDIDTDKEEYTIVLDCRGKKILSKGFYKTDLFVDLLKGKGKKVAENFVGQAKEMSQKMMSNITSVMGIPPQEKVYEVQ